MMTIVLAVRRLSGQNATNEHEWELKFLKKSATSERKGRVLNADDDDRRCIGNRTPENPSTRCGTSATSTSMCHILAIFHEFEAADQKKKQKRFLFLR